MNSIKPFGRYFGDGSDTDETSKRKIGQWINKISEENNRIYKMI